MRLIYLATLYTALALGANTLFADSGKFAQLDQLKLGDMRKLAFHQSAITVPDTPFFTEDGKEITLRDMKDRITLVNFWATWCTPCREEMPSLQRLNDILGGNDFQVLTIATMRSSKQAIDAFFDDAEISDLPKHQDPKGTLARAIGVAALPITIILDKNSDEIARLPGDAHWDSPEAIALLSRLIEFDQQSDDH